MGSIFTTSAPSLFGLQVPSALSSPMDDGVLPTVEKNAAGGGLQQLGGRRDSGFICDSPKDDAASATTATTAQASLYHHHSTHLHPQQQQQQQQRPLSSATDDMPVRSIILPEHKPFHVISSPGLRGSSVSRPKSACDKENLRVAVHQHKQHTTEKPNSVSSTQKSRTLSDSHDHQHLAGLGSSAVQHQLQHQIAEEPHATASHHGNVAEQSSSTGTASSSPQVMFSQLRIDKTIYRVLRQIGSGGFSSVFSVVREPDGKLFALKQVRVPSDDQLNAALREADILRGLADTGCVVRVFEVAAVRKKNMALMILMELGNADLGSWMNSLSTTKPPLPAFEADGYLCRSLFRQMTHAISLLHSRGIVHNDLKPSNWLFTGGCHLKLIDFGVSRQLPTDKTSQVELDKLCGTLDYMSPERLSDRRTSPAGDVWALGCILHEMAFGLAPFGHIDNALGKITNIASLSKDFSIPYPPRHLLHESCDKIATSEPSLIAIIRACLKKAPKQRPTATELLSHAFLSETKHFDSSKSQHCTIPEACNILRTATTRMPSGEIRKQFVSSVLDFLLGNSQQPPQS